MENINENSKITIDIIKKQTNNNPDIIIKKMKFNNYNLSLVFSESMSDRATINEFILKYITLQEEKSKIKDIFEYLKENIPAHKIQKVKTLNDLMYSLLSGFSIILIDGFTEAITIETKGTLNSSIAPAENEKTLKGPKDAFTENYQINIGLIRKRLKTKRLKLDETVVGTIGKSKVGIVSIDGIVRNDVLDYIINKIKKINIDSVFDTSQIVEIISENEKNVLPNFLATERPDYAAMLLLEGRIAIILENSPYVAIVPVFIDDFFHSPEDMYNRTLNSTINRFIRFFAFLLTLLTPAIYVAITTYNHETIPSKLLINFSIQRDGVPFSTVVEALFMTLTFEILKETDTRIPSSIGNSLSIVGALVLGDAAVTAGIVSPIMVIVIAITSISGLIISYTDVSNGIRWWRIWFLIGASTAGILGIVVAGLIFVTNMVSIKSFGLPFMAPYSPFVKSNISNSLFLTFYNKYFKRNTYTAKDNCKIEEE